jgi:hypothetical protein
VRELHPSCTTQVYGTMQALYLAQVCSLGRTYHSVAPAFTRASTASSWLLARAAARGVQPAGVDSTVEVSTSLQQRPCDLHWPSVAALYLRDRLSNPVSRPDTAEGGTRVRPT